MPDISTEPETLKAPDISKDHVPEAVYGERLLRFEKEQTLLELSSRTLSFLRLGVFLAFLGILVFQFWGATRPSAGGLLVAGGLLLSFVVLARRHGRLLRSLERARELAEIQREGLARLDRRWGDLPQRPMAVTPGAEAVARDLGIAGPASLGHLLSTVATPPGRKVLGQWLSEPAPPDEIRARQEVVLELATKLDLRQELEIRGRALARADFRPEPFLRWAEEGDPDLPGRRWILGARVLTVAVVVATVALAFGASWRWLAVLLLGNFGYSYRFASSMHALFARVSAREAPFRRCAEMLQFLSEGEFESSRLQAVQGDLERAGDSAHRELDRLHRLIDLSDLRLSSLHAVVQAITLWDFHLLDRMEAWRRRAGGEVRLWLHSLGEAEALAGFAGIAFDEPTWVLPEIVEDAVGIDAWELAHPLLPAGRAGYDVEVGPPGTFLLVTGSNMSGKSTLLRALGLNAVLAQAGGPVCAQSLRLPPLNLATSILVEDSLVDGASFFWAELQRLKDVVTAAEQARLQGRTLLYLLDEVLRGTNSAERRIAVEKVLAHLLEEGAIGAISTHDFELARLESLSTSARPVYFRETLDPDGDPVMTFDYRLREGIAPTTNALELLALVGLDSDRPPRKT